MTAKTAPEADRAKLTKAAVIDRALALGDAEGLQAVTVRRLATELGVTPMALYWHFRSKDDLMVGLADRVWAEIDTRVDQNSEWPLQIRGLLKSLVGVLRRHQCASQLLLASEVQSSPAALRSTEVALSILRGAGFDPVHAAAIARLGLWTGITLVMSQPGFVPGLTEAQRTEMQRQSLVELSLLPPDQYPHVVEAARPLTTSDNLEFHYEFGIDLFIAGVKAAAQELGTGRR